MITLRLGPLAAMACAAAVTLSAQSAPVRTFDADPLDATPSGFTFASMRQPTAGVWRIGASPGERFLIHGPDRVASGYAMAVVEGSPIRNVVVSARLKLVGGGHAGGLVWRYQDAQNYYAAVLDLAAGTLSMHRIADGNRITIEREGDLELDPGGWHTLKVVHADATVYISIGGIRVINERDRRLDRFGPGRAGLLAAGDSEVWFDDVRIEPGRVRP